MISKRLRKLKAELTLLWGPPWQAGKTASLMRFSISDSLVLLKKMSPARGPRRVLWLLGQIAKVSLRCSAQMKRSGPKSGNARGGADDIAVLEGVVLNLSGNESRDVGHVHPGGQPKDDQLGSEFKLGAGQSSHEVRAVHVSNLAEAGVVKVPGVGRSTADEDPGLEEEGVLLEGIVVDETGGGVHLVREGLEVDGRSRDVALRSEGTVGTVVQQSRGIMSFLTEPRRSPNWLTGDLRRQDRDP